MPLLLRTALLTAAALAAVAFAAVRITNAAEHRTIPEGPGLSIPEVTPAEAAATLAKLHAPPGFRKADCRLASQELGQKCFWTPRVLALDTQTMGRIVTFEKGRSEPGIPCFGNRPGRRRSYLLRSCTQVFELGPELVDLLANSLVIPPSRDHTRVAQKALRYWRRGTELDMKAIGHRPHEKEAHEQPAPTASG